MATCVECGREVSDSNIGKWDPPACLPCLREDSEIERLRLQLAEERAAQASSPSWARDRGRMMALLRKLNRAVYVGLKESNDYRGMTRNDSGLLS